MSKLWKYEKKFRFFQIYTLEYPLNITKYTYLCASIQIIIYLIYLWYLWLSARSINVLLWDKNGADRYSYISLFSYMYNFSKECFKSSHWYVLYTTWKRRRPAKFLLLVARTSRNIEQPLVGCWNDISPREATVLRRLFYHRTPPGPWKWRVVDNLFLLVFLSPTSRLSLCFLSNLPPFLPKNLSPRLFVTLFLVLLRISLLHIYIYIYIYNKIINEACIPMMYAENLPLRAFLSLQLHTYFRYDTNNILNLFALVNVSKHTDLLFFVNRIFLFRQFEDVAISLGKILLRMNPVHW